MGSRVLFISAGVLLVTAQAAGLGCESANESRAGCAQAAAGGAWGRAITSSTKGSGDMLSLKAGVNPKGIQPEILLAIISIERLYDKYGHELVITSLFDGKHGAHTLHQRDGVCRAVDVRTRMLPNEIIPNMLQEIKDALGPHYDVVLEADHIHVEFDIKPELLAKV